MQKAKSFIINLPSKLNPIGEWIPRLVCLQLMWVIFSILGFGVLGLFPATAASFALIRKWKKKDKFKWWSTFWKYYKKDFWYTNGLGYTVLLMLIILYVDFRYFEAMNNVFMNVIGFIFLLGAVVTLVGMLMLWPMYSHYELSFKEYLKNVFFYPLSYPKESILIILTLVAAWYVYYAFTGLLVFLGVSLIMYIIYSILEKSFNNPKKPEKTLGKKQQEQSIYFS